MIKKIIRLIKIKKIKKNWRRKNSKNFTSLGKITNNAAMQFIENGYLTVGDGSYGVLNIHTSGNPRERMRIGKYCQISGYSHFLLGGEHCYKWISAYPFKEMIFNKGISSFTKGEIILEDEVWVGHEALILSGCHIGKGAIIAAGAVVTEDIPPYCIAAGVPAKIIKKRFSDEIIEKLLAFQIPYEKLLEKDLEYLETEITDDTVDNIISYFEKVQKER